MGSESEASSRLSSVLEVCENEGRALEDLPDERLTAVLQAMSKLRAEIVAALASLREPPPNGRS